MIKLFRLID